MEYAKCMILGYSIRKSAEMAGVCVKTSFFMRHKLLDAVRIYTGMGNLEGVVKMDETFLLSHLRET